MPGRAWNMTGACMKENGATGGRKKCSPARLAILGSTTTGERRGRWECQGHVRRLERRNWRVAEDRAA